MLAGPPSQQTLDTFGATLAWTNPPGTTQIQLQLVPFNGDGPGADLHLGSPETSFAIPPPPIWYGLLPDMTYTWRVRASSESTFADLNSPSWSPWVQATFRTPKVSSTTISAVSTSDGSAVTTRVPWLQWANSNPYVWWYELQLSKDPEFANAAVYGGLNHGGVSKNSYQVPLPLEPDTAYYWRVRPRIQGDGNQALTSLPRSGQRLQEWSALWSFRTPFETPSPIIFGIPNPLPAGVVGQPYRFSFCTPDPGAPGIASPDLCWPVHNAALIGGVPNPSGGHEPYHFDKDPGSQFWQLGLTLNTNGVLDGIPSAEGPSQFVICAIDLDGHQSCQPTTLTILPAPVGLPAPAVLTASRCTYPDKIWVAWSAVEGAASYNVYRNTLNAKVTAVSVLRANLHQFDDFNIAVGTTYYYWVRAVDANGVEGDYSASANGMACRATTTPTITPTPTPTATSTPRTAFSYAWGCLLTRNVYSDGSSGNLTYRMDISTWATIPGRVSVDFGVLGKGTGTLSGTQISGTYDTPTYGTGSGSWSGSISADGKSGSGNLSGTWQQSSSDRRPTTVTGNWTIYSDRSTRPCS